MKPLAFVIACVLCIGLIQSCKQTPTSPPGGKGSVKCDTCDTIKQPCDTCDTTHGGADTISHDFACEQTLNEEHSLSSCWVFDKDHIWAVGGKIHEWDGQRWTTLDPRTSGGKSVTLADAGLFAFNLSDAWFTHGSIVWHIQESVAGVFRLNTLGVFDINTDGILHACWGTSSSDMFFVGEKGTIVHFDGTNWVKYPKVTGKALIRVTGTAHNNVWAGGFDLTSGESVLLHFDGNAWTEVPLSELPGFVEAPDGLSGLYATADSINRQSLVVAGAFVYTKDRYGWRKDTMNSKVPGGYDALIAVSGNFANDYMVMGTGGFVGHNNGKDWRDFPDLFKYTEAGYLTKALSFKGNTAVICGTRHGSGWLAIGTRK